MQDPTIEQRDALRYVAVSRRGDSIDGFPAAVDGGYPELFGWLDKQRLAPVAAPFIRYVVFDPDGAFEIELGVPVADAAEGSDGVHVGLLPAGRYVTYVHVGAYRATTEHWAGRDLVAAQQHVHRWIAAQRLAVDERPSERGPILGASVEHYRVGPPLERDPEKWETELAIRLRD